MTCKLAAPYPEAPPSQPSPQKVVLITDGLSHAGLVIATYLSRSGHHVFGTVLQTAHTPARLPLEPLQVDPRCDGSVRQAVAQLIAATGRVDALVNNSDACIAAAFEEMSFTQARQLFEANFFDALRITEAVLPRMRQQGIGRIVNLISIPTTGPAPYLGIYGSTQAALESWSASLDRELRRDGIRVSSIRRGIKRPGPSSIHLPDRPLSRHEANRFAALQQVNVPDRDLAQGNWLDNEFLAECVGAAILDASPRPVYTARKPLHRMAALWSRLASKLRADEPSPLKPTAEPPRNTQNMRPQTWPASLAPQAGFEIDG